MKTAASGSRLGVRARPRPRRAARAASSSSLLLSHPADRPVVPTTAAAALPAAAWRSGQRLQDVVEDPARPSCRSSAPPSARLHGRRPRVASPNTCGVPANELPREPRARRTRGRLASLLEQGREEVDLEEEVTSLARAAPVIFRELAVGDLVGLLGPCAGRSSARSAHGPQALRAAAGSGPEVEEAPPRGSRDGNLLGGGVGGRVRERGASSKPASGDLALVVLLAGPRPTPASPHCASAGGSVVRIDALTLSSEVVVAFRTSDMASIT